VKGFLLWDRAHPARIWLSHIAGSSCGRQNVDPSTCAARVPGV
jgi:hypothetical protein